MPKVPFLLDAFTYTISNGEDWLWSIHMGTVSHLINDRYIGYKW